jgi:Fe-S cluster biosynthesis and repair protein YggX
MDEKILNMDDKVTVRNLAPWSIGFPNLVGRGDTTIAPSSETRMKRDEIVDQVSSGNKLLTGNDSYGSHATIFIDDAETRKYLEFDSEDGKRTQNIISSDKVAKWFELKTMTAFKKNIEENVITRAEKQFVLKAIQDLKLDSYEKIEFCKEYCKFKLRR